MSNKAFPFGRPLFQRELIELGGGKRFETMAFDPETYSFLNSTGDPSSCFAKLLALATENLLVRTIFFQDFDRCFPGPNKILELGDKAAESIMKFYTTEFPPSSSITIPLFGDTIDLKHIEQTTEEGMKQAETQLKSFLDFTKVVFEIFQDSFEQFSRALIIEATQGVLEDRNFRVRAARLGNKETKDLIRKALNDRVLPKSKEKLEANKKRFGNIPNVGSSAGLQTYKLLRLWSTYKKSFSCLYEDLSSVSKNHCELDTRNVTDFLKKLQKTQVIRQLQVKGGCVNFSDCYNYVDSYSMSHVTSKCPECSKETMFWMAYGLLDERVLHAWRMHLLPEMIAGAILSSVDWVEKVWVHEMVKQILPIQSSACEVDCLVKTHDGKMLIVETSATRDLEHVHKDFIDKIDTMKGLPYDGMFYVTPANITEYITGEPIEPRAFLLGLKHFHDIPGIIKGCMEQKLHNAIKPGS